VACNADNDSSAVLDATSSRIGRFVERTHQLLAIFSCFGAAEKAASRHNG
jgi:hypothetical protein